MRKNDALGWIELDEGGRVRFGGTSLQGFTTVPGVGSRIEVHGTQPGFKGVPKAVKVVPLLAPGEAAARAAAMVAWPDFVHAHPRWSDADDACVPCARPALAPALSAHPLFAPWRREICETAPTGVELVVPTYMREDACEPDAGDSSAHGRVAFLDEPRWPNCGICARPLQMCVQIAPAVLADFVPGGRGLVALFCFHCGYRERVGPRIGHVRLGSGWIQPVAESGWISRRG